ncbi:MAG: hypothetical protein AAF399_20355 [Bacteroidota bacterium]
MMSLLSLKSQNEVLFWFGLVNLIAAMLMLGLSWLKPLEFAGVNAWFKPIKFALSTTILSWTMMVFTSYLPQGRDISIFNWVLVITLGFEVIYIALQASRGQASHFNLSTPFYSAMYSLMAMAASVATLAVGYIGVQFFLNSFPDLPPAYVWAIRLGIILFVIFSFEGFVMGSRMTHTVGGADGSPGLPFLNWSLTYGDLRVAHFIGMHALQVLPLLAWYLLKDVRLTVGAFVLYACLAVLILLQALRGNSVASTISSTLS